MDDQTDNTPTRIPTQQKRVKDTIIPVIKEQVAISSRERITGEVEVRKVVHSEEVDIPLTTLHTHYRESRVPINRVVDTMPQVRYEGKNLIVPVIREEEVVVKRIILVEEIHLIQEQSSEERTEHVELRTEEATVHRRGGGANNQQPKE